MAIRQKYKADSSENLFNRLKRLTDGRSQAGAIIIFEIKEKNGKKLHQACMFQCHYVFNRKEYDTFYITKVSNVKIP